MTNVRHLAFSLMSYSSLTSVGVLFFSNSNLLSMIIIIIIIIIIINNI
jgi:hypothetical protein